MMSNPMQVITSQLRRGMNPNAILSQMAQRDPRVAQVMQITRGKSNAEMRQYAENLARERGVDLDTFVRSMGITIPSNK